MDFISCNATENYMLDLHLSELKNNLNNLLKHLNNNNSNFLFNSKDNITSTLKEVIHTLSLKNDCVNNDDIKKLEFQSKSLNIITPVYYKTSINSNFTYIDVCINTLLRLKNNYNTPSSYYSIYLNELYIYLSFLKNYTSWLRSDLLVL